MEIPTPSKVRNYRILHVFDRLPLSNTLQEKSPFKAIFLAYIKIIHYLCTRIQLRAPHSPTKLVGDPALGKPVRFWHRPAAVICNIVCSESKSLANCQLSTVNCQLPKLGRLNKRAISQKTCCMSPTELAVKEV